MDKADFVRILIKYTEFLVQYDANYPYLISVINIKDTPMELWRMTPSEVLNQRKGIFIQLQAISVRGSRQSSRLWNQGLQGRRLR